MTRRMPPLVITAAYAALIVGSISGLGWLAPLEYGTGTWLGLGSIGAAVVPGLIDSYVVLSVLTARDRRWSLPIAGLSGFVGQLHAAGVLPAADPRVRGCVAGLAAVIAVAVTARLKPLVAEVVDGYRMSVAAAEVAELEASRAFDLAEVEAVQMAERARLETVALAGRLADEKAARDRSMAEPTRSARTASSTVTRTARSQVKRHAHPGLTEAETDILTAMLGQGEMSRAAVILASGRPEGTVKAALVKLTKTGRVEPVEGRRGQYVVVEPAALQAGR